MGPIPEKLEIAKREAEEAEELSKDPKNTVNLNLSNQMKQAMDTSRLWDAVSQWDTETTIKNHTFYFQLHRTTTQQAAEQTRRDRFNLEAELKRRQQEISEDGKQKIRDLTNPLTQAERKAILDAIDDILGIRIDPDDDGARLSPAAAMYNDTVTAGTSPTDSVPQPPPSSCQGAATPENTAKPNNTVENSTNSKAKSCKNTVENISSLSVSSVKSVVAPSPSVSDSTSVTSAFSVVRSSDSPLRTPNSAFPANTVENPNNSKAETSKNTVENQESPTAVPSPACPPQRRATARGEGQPARRSLGEGGGEGGFYCQTAPSAPSVQQSTNPSIQQIHRDPFPISPLASTPPSRKQPRNHIPLLDIYGQLIQWVPRDEELTIENVVGFGNRRGQNTCWLNPKLVDPPPVHRNVPIVSWNGQILEWVPAEFEPFEKAEPIRSRRYLHYKIGWWEQAREEHPQYNSSAGCMVA